MKIHIIMHESFEAPGAIEDWAKQRKHEITYTRLYEGTKLQEIVENIDFLIVMGGPQSPATTKDECPNFDAAQEIKFIRNAISAGKLVLGVCLGAQLIGEALGAKFDHSPNREIGVFELTLTTDAKDDPIFSKFPKKFLVGHWHGDMPGLTAESKVLAISKGCPRQIVSYTPKVYGFQCHFEFTSETIEGMVRNCGQELRQYEGLPYIQTEEELRKQDYDAMNKLLFAFLDYMESMSKTTSL
ncbi:gamma-glutamyl-gamma-aminobutyrate hydrolase family protein [Candidatus Micrarchaeota archaeon]|nr:gamma-glutamyl-gamma-aminobutyrate hydrolase family protein [Candidatus Micrarchaeota archaeon]